MLSIFQKPLSKLTKDPDEQGNALRLGTNSVLRNASIPLYTGEVYQAWFFRLGIKTDQIAFIGIPGTIVGYVMMLLSCALSDRITNRMRAFLLLTLCSCSGALGYLIMALGPSCFRTLAGVATISIIMAIFGSLTNPFYATVSAMIDCRTIHNSIRGRFWSIFGMIGGVVGLAFGAIATYVLKYVAAPYNFAICFAMAVAMTVAATFVLRGLKDLPDLVNETVAKKESVWKDIMKIIKLREFRILMPANLLRGMGDGAGGYITYLAFKQLALGDEYAGYTTLLGYVALFASYALIGATFDRFGAGKVLPFVEVLLVIGLIGAIVTPSAYVFLAFYLLWKTMQMLEASAIPLAHYQIVPTEVMGNFSGVRLMMLNITAGLSGTLTGIALAHFAPLLVFSICAVIKLAAGAVYCYGLYAVKKPDSRAKPA